MQVLPYAPPRAVMASAEGVVVSASPQTAAAGRLSSKAIATPLAQLAAMRCDDGPASHAVVERRTHGSKQMGVVGIEAISSGVRCSVRMNAAF